MYESGSDTLDGLQESRSSKIFKLKMKNRELEKRIKGEQNSSNGNSSPTSSKSPNFDGLFDSRKRANPFLKNSSIEFKKPKPNESSIEESTENTLFQTLTDITLDTNASTSFNGVLSKLTEFTQEEKTVDIQINTPGKKSCPIDWTLKKKMRLISPKPFAWNQQLKLSEEASGITSFTRCLDIDNSDTTLNASANTKFHQCCLFWQHPFIPWLQLFPRNTSKVMKSGINIGASSIAKSSLHNVWIDSFKSLFQLTRTRQCPYFYVCANNFTILFRAAGIVGFTDLQIIVTPTTRGFRYLLKQEEIEFTMPLKKQRMSDQSNSGQDSGSLESDSQLTGEDEPEGDEEDIPDEEWLKNMGINSDDIKQINYVQGKITYKSECEVDSTEQSLILIDGTDANAFFNFLINCKSIIASSGHLAGIPPTLLAPVAFHGATLTSLKVKASKIHVDGADFHSLELIGPILPTMVHNIFHINPSDYSLTVILNNIENTKAFSKVQNNNSETENICSEVFGEENLSDAGLNRKVLKRFCSVHSKVCNFECVQYCGENETFTWT